jgi:hypothetical protein
MTGMADPGGRKAAWSGGFAKGPSEPFAPQQQREVRARLEEGEPQDDIARSYSVDVDTIRQLAQILLADRFIGR